MEHKITDQLHYGVYLATPEFLAINEHSCVCYEDMTLVAVTGRAEDELSQKYAELFASAPALVDAVAALAAENAKLRALIQDTYNYWYKPRTSGKNIDGVALKESMEEFTKGGAK